ncbi:DUF4129 domain-containing protein [Streptomyces sp. ODS28]|uniref:DUF4129 domain-containing protein n=1 Tax=Streptomyces sp. ODS28 TaxID=3136688 RepID=UPI0031EEC780
MPGGLTTKALSALLSAAPGSAPGDDVPVTTPRTPAREAAEHELSDPAYHQNDPSLLARILDWVVDRIDSLLSRAAEATPGGWIGITVLIALAVLLVVALRLRLGRLRQATGTGPDHLYPDGPRSAADHRAAAERHATEGQWNEALQERMRAIVRSLEERALLAPRPGRTADEAATEAGDALPDHAQHLRAAALAFDEVTYADRDADENRYARMRDLDTELQNAKPRLTPTGGGAR